MGADAFTVSRAGRGLRGTVRIPADKSISHRALLLSALAQGSTRIENFLWSTTTRATLDCLQSLGARIETTVPDALTVDGRGLRSLSRPAGDLFCQGSGTTMRLLAGLCAGQPFPSVLDGTPALRRRPMARVAGPLRRMGASVLALGQDERPPLQIQGASQLKGMEHNLTVASAQVKSAILLAGLYADGPTTIREPSPCRDHTERMLGAFGVPVQALSDGAVLLEPAPLVAPASPLVLPNDFSSAAFFIAAGLLVPGSGLCLPRVGLNPTRTGMLDVISEMGASVRIENEYEENGEPVADLVVRY
ncbi:MAG: 3-phosphoshikimate 1-carboxyvinyltransferase, partial [Rudaea sp.]